MNFGEFYTLVQKFLPGAEIGEEDDGSLVIHTNRIEDREGQIILRDCPECGSDRDQGCDSGCITGKWNGDGTS